MNRPDAWNPLREFTDARIALGRSGASLPTREVLNFGLAHARARDAIHQPFASQQLVAPLAALGLEVLNFGLAHARARDAIHQPFASQQLVAPLAALG
ncbi:ethanolamine ammonia-lyase subunit EutC, partial [Klebsiella pneumoniae]|uniref:ethanolamine ammonia-lyase subunit EutC n=1 Tax=Klebsiella pneumoniae TaxID=573 RepID=UPI0021BFDFF3